MTLIMLMRRGQLGTLGFAGMQRLTAPGVSVFSRWRISVRSTPGFLRPTSTSAPPRPTNRAKNAYPEKLLIYHAGTARTTFLACIKLTTLFTCAFFTLLVTPAYLASPDKPLHQAAGFLACGLVPFAFVAWSTTPFVAHVHVRLPPYAQASRALLERFARRGPPAATRIAVSTTNLVGKPRVSEMALADLRPVRERLGMVNFARDPPLEAGGGAGWRRWVGWLVLPPSTKFNIPQRPRGSAQEGWVWDELAKGIVRRSGGGGR